MQANTESKHSKQAYVNILGDVNMVLKTSMELVSSSKKLALQASKHSKQASTQSKQALKASKQAHKASTQSKQMLIFQEMLKLKR